MRRRRRRGRIEGRYRWCPLENCSRSLAPREDAAAALPWLARLLEACKGLQRPCANKDAAFVCVCVLSVCCVVCGNGVEGDQDVRRPAGDQSNPGARACERVSTLTATTQPRLSRSQCREPKLVSSVYNDAEVSTLKHSLASSSWQPRRRQGRRASFRIQLPPWSLCALLGFLRPRPLSPLLHHRPHMACALPAGNAMPEATEEETAGTWLKADVPGA